MFKIIEMDRNRIVPVIAANSALVLTYALFQLACGLAHVYEATWTRYHVHYVCGSTSYYTLNRERSIVVGMAESMYFLGIVALRAATTAVVASGYGG